jgi:peptidoglycan/LPS O-acetylase OafA/YrhL
MTGDIPPDAPHSSGVLPPQQKEFQVGEDSSRLSGEARVRELDGLRGIAILAVVVFHLLIVHLHVSFPKIELTDGLTLLAYGVDLFFVISGFLIGTILLRMDRPAGIGAFYIRRIVRIWPLYYLLLFLVYLALPEKSLFSDAPPWSFFLFIFNLWESAGSHIHPALGPLWSVAVEEQFYLLGPVLFSIFNRRQLSVFLLACLLFSPLLRLILLSTTTLDLWRFTPARIDGICAGLLLALFLASPVNVDFVAKRMKLFKGLMFGLLGLLLPVQILFSDSVWGSLGHSLVVLAFACVLLVVQVQCSLHQRIPFLDWGVLRYLGLRCYSIYLFHIFFTFIADTLSDNTYVRLILELMLILLFAHFSWRYIETPLLKFGRKFSYRKKPKPDPVMV